MFAEHSWSADRFVGRGVDHLHLTGLMRVPRWMLWRHRAQVGVILATACLLLGAGLWRPDASRAAALTTTTTSSDPSLQSRVAELEDERSWIIAPMAVLIGVLTIGGALSVVFSLRDQRRVSQLHELAVSGEFAAQRRAEQSHASFLEESQKTLTLVNDTLRLAKEATDRANQAADVKSKARRDAIEERAAKVMFAVFDAQDFDALLLDNAHFAELEAIARDLRDFEASVRSEGLTLLPYSAFIRAIDRFLHNDTDGAQHALHVLDQDRPVGDLHRFTLYWLGYIATTLGKYDEAINRFVDDEAGLAKGHVERFQLDRIINDTKFFKHARDWDDQRRNAGKDGPGRSIDRYGHVAAVLAALAKLADDIGNADEMHRGHTSHQVARTRADIYAWIAYHPTRLHEPLEHGAVLAAQQAIDDVRAEHDKSATESNDQFGAEAVRKSDADLQAAYAAFEAAAFAKLADQPDAARALAWLQARSICSAEEPPDHDLRFAMAECDFALLNESEDEKEVSGRRKLLVDSFDAVVAGLAEQRRQHRELRKIAELEATAVTCHARLAGLRSGDAQLSEAQQARTTQRHAVDAADDLHADVTVFSSLQRRNLQQRAFVDEVDALVKQAHLDASSAATTPDE